MEARSAREGTNITVASGLPQAACCVIIPPHDHTSRQQTVDHATQSLARLGMAADLICIDEPTGEALAVAIASSTAPVLILYDARQGATLEDLDCLLPQAARSDLVCGRRRHGDRRLAERMGRTLFALLAKRLAGTQLDDPTCPLMVLRRSAVAPLIHNLPGGALFQPALAGRAAAAGLRIAETDIQEPPPAKTTLVQTCRRTASDLASLVRYWWNEIEFPSHASLLSASANWFWWGLAAVALVAGSLLFPFLDYPLFEPDESRYAQIPREMLARGEWVVPYLQGEPYLDKPPLFYGLVMLSYRALGAHDWAARLVPASAAWLTVLVTYLFGCRTIGCRAALFAALALSLSLGYAPGGRFLILDSMLALWISLSMHLALEAILKPRFHWGWWIGSALCCGLAIMTKGPIGLVLWLPPLAAFAWLDRHAARLTLVRLAAYLAIAALVVLPWFAAVMIRMPNFVEYFFWEHHVQRFLSGLNHAEPVWYYLPVLAIVLTPWTFLVIPYLHFQFSRQPATAALRPRVTGFYLLWAAWCVAFFSAASCKLPTYILPALPAMALLLGVYLHQATAIQRFPATVNWARRVAPQWAVSVLCCTGLGVIWAACLLGLRSLAETVIESLVWAAVLVAAIVYGQRLRRAVAWLVCGLVAFVVTFESARQIVPAWAESRSPIPHDSPLAALLRDRQTAVVVCYQEWGSVPFYLERNDVLRFDGHRPRELAKVLEQHARTVLVHKRGQSLESLQSLVPPGMIMNQVGEAGRASFWLVQPARYAKGRLGAAKLPAGRGATR
jgi:dolichol-phosphate mannosyltransferase